MSEDAVPTYARGALRPVECLRGGWQLIKDDYWLFFGITAVGVLIANFGPFGILLGPMMCGIYLCLLRKDAGRRVRFETLFNGFNYFLPSLIAALFMVVPVILIVIPFYGLMFWDVFGNLMQGGAPNPNTPFRMLGWMGAMIGVVIIVQAITAVLFFFAFPLIVAREMSGLQAIGMSLRAVMANLGGVLALVILHGLLLTAGLLACCVGQFFVVPLNIAANVVAFRQVFGVEEDADAITDK